MLKILITGTRGKSTLVRLLHGALTACGIKCYSRITGVIPRQLDPAGGMTPILRLACGHVEEMRWWLKQLPPEAEAMVLENSAIAPELQPLAGRWLRPQIVVLTNLLADHFETWGPTKEQAAEVLLAGIPARATVIAPYGALAQSEIKASLAAKECRIVSVSPETKDQSDIDKNNITLALAVCDHLELPREKTEPAMRGLAPDLADFRVMHINGAELAFAFSANDPQSSLTLFSSLGWPLEKTRLVYNHRQDRPARLREFARQVFTGKWQKRLIIGDRPWPLPKGTHYVKATDPEQFRGLFYAGQRVFGCGNVKGLPLGLLADHTSHFPRPAGESPQP
ncbi:MAG: Mur ligase family protein [Desulfarculaceae bacterium]|jgi:poly-gamma-glutamate synthase PgsB/CapB